MGCPHIPLIEFLIPTYLSLFPKNVLPSKQQFILSASGMKVNSSAGIQDNTNYLDKSESDSLNLPKRM